MEYLIIIGVILVGSITVKLIQNIKKSLKATEEDLKEEEDLEQILEQRERARERAGDYNKSDETNVSDESKKHGSFIEVCYFTLSDHEKKYLTPGSRAFNTFYNPARHTTLAEWSARQKLPSEIKTIFLRLT